MKFEVQIRVDTIYMVIEAEERGEAEYQALEELRSDLDSKYQVFINEVK